MRAHPWGVHTIRSMVAPDGVQVGLRDGRCARAVPEPYAPNLFERFRAAWWVLSGSAHAVLWPEPGDLERAMAPLTEPLVARWRDGFVPPPDADGPK